MIPTFTKKKFQTHLKKLKKSTHANAIFDQTYQFVHINSVFVKYFRSTKSVLKGKTIFNLLQETQSLHQIKGFDFLQNKLKELKSKENGKIAFVCEFKTIDSFRFWANVNFFLLKVGENYLYQILLTKIDNPENMDSNNIKSQNNSFISESYSSEGGSSNYTSSSQRRDGLKKSAKISTIFLSDGEAEEDFDDEITFMKNSVRSLSNTKYEQGLIDKLNKIEIIFENTLETKNAEILNAIDYLKKERTIQRQKYDELETLLQRRLTGLETEKTTMKSMSSDFSILDQKKQISTKLLKQYCKINSQIMKVLLAKTNEELTKIEKTIN
ncbi:hypothetical protein M0813_02227 [Anaeramoeba flamelloides]|uniref:Uncharacterized protein n=1 Tax=Anaeramoeba flamelloides TaxID=1746091 RepID=A0ABQ8YQW3_9EUKA|nr:hypothetical protein M0813_02227 [Anaeramoeba flamelloides]